MIDWFIHLTRVKLFTGNMKATTWIHLKNSLWAHNPNFAHKYDLLAHEKQRPRTLSIMTVLLTNENQN